MFVSASGTCPSSRTCAAHEALPEVRSSRRAHLLPALPRPTPDPLRLWVRESEARALLALPIPETVRAKLLAKLDKPPEPILGQLDILTAITEQEDHTNDHSSCI